MALTPNQQLFELLGRSSEVLLAVTPGPSTDALASALALRLLLEGLGKRVEVVSHGFSPSRKHAFLPGVAAVRPELPHLRKMVLRVDLGMAKLHDLSWEVADGALAIHLTPRSGTWKPEDVRATPAEYRFDLAIILGAEDLEALGPIYEAHPDFFFTTPTINIDHHPANEHFGTLNAVDVTATSVSEALCDLFAGHRQLFDQEVATALLAGIISSTKSFKTDSVTPKVLAITGELVAMGGRREEVVRHLYRTRSVPTLRLWGRALARLKFDAPTGLVWTVLTHSDFVHAGAGEEELPGVIEEIITFCPEARVIAVLSEGSDGITGLLETRKTHDALLLAKPFGASGSRHAVRFTLPKASLVDAERDIISKLKTGLAA